MSSMRASLALAFASTNLCSLYLQKCIVHGIKMHASDSARSRIHRLKGDMFSKSGAPNDL